MLAAHTLLNSPYEQLVRHRKGKRKKGKKGKKQKAKAKAKGDGEGILVWRTQLKPMHNFE